MGIYLVRGSAQKIEDIILSFIKQESLELNDSRFLGSQCLDNGAMPVFCASTPLASGRNSSLYFQWHCLPYEFQTKVEMKIEIAKRERVAMAWRVILSLSLLVLLVLLVLEGPKWAPISPTSILTFLVYLTGCSIFGIYLSFFLQYRRHSRKIKDFENKFLALLSTALLTEKIASSSVFSKMFTFLFATVITILFYIVLYLFGFKLFALLVSIFLFQWIVSFYVGMFSKENLYSKWKHSLTTLNNIWSSWQCGISLLAVILISIKPMLHLQVSLSNNLSFIFIVCILCAWNVLPFVSFNFVTKWHQLLGKKQEIFPQPPAITSITKRESLIGKSLIIVQVPFAFILHWLAVLISIDAVFFIKNNDTIFFKFTKEAFDLILHFSFGSKIITSVILFILALPSIMIFLNRLTYVIMSIKENIRLINLPEYSSIPYQVKYFVEVTANSLKTKVPRMIVDEKTKIPIKSSLMFPFFSRPAIIINAGILKDLSNEELESMIAHEFYHIKYNLYPLFIANLASWLCLFPNNYFTLYFDFVKMEFEADRFAMDITKSRTYLISALIKNNEAGFINDSVKQLSSINKLKIFMQFYFGDALLGYVYPQPIERLNEINRYAFKQSD